MSLIAYDGLRDMFANICDIVYPQIMRYYNEEDHGSKRILLCVGGLGSENDEIYGQHINSLPYVHFDTISTANRMRSTHYTTISPPLREFIHLLQDKFVSRHERERRQHMEVKEVRQEQDAERYEDKPKNKYNCPPTHSLWPEEEIVEEMAKIKSIPGLFRNYGYTPDDKLYCLREIAISNLDMKEKMRLELEETLAEELEEEERHDREYELRLAYLTEERERLDREYYGTS